MAEEEEEWGTETTTFRVCILFQTVFTDHTGVIGNILEIVLTPGQGEGSS